MVIQSRRSINIEYSLINLSPKEALITCGIKSPIMIKYETATPKHFMAIALSNNKAADGYVNFDTEKNEDLRPLVCVALRDNKYNPIPEVMAAKITIILPNKSPTDAMAAG